MLSGGPAPQPRHATLQQALARAAESASGLTFLDGSEREQFIPYQELHQRAQKAAGALRARGVVRGDRVAIVLPTCPEFVVAFFGALYAGAIPVPLYPPVRLGRLDEFHARTARMLEVTEARIVLSDARISRLLGISVARAQPPLGLHEVAQGPEHFEAGAPEELALIQFSSGTTVDPKPVALTHFNILSNIAAIDGFIPRDGSEAGVSWLPLYHDMGLIGCLLLAVAHPGPLTLLGPEVFLARPALWLRAVSRKRAVISVAPNFAYGLCVRRIRDEELSGVDLSSWKLALNGAEPVAPAVLRRFADRFSRWGFSPQSFMPVYGLSEASLAVTFTPPGQGARTVVAEGREIASVGVPVPGMEVRIADGAVLVRGPSVMERYFGAAQSALTGGAGSAGDGRSANARSIGDGWLATGDLGFIRDGELYVSGRAKELIIIRGANHAPQQFEDALDGLDGARPGCAVAVGLPTPEGEELALLVERDGALDEEAVRARVLEATGIRAAQVHLLEPGTLPRTSSGKLRRGEALRQLLAQELKPPARLNAFTLAREVLRSALAANKAARVDVEIAIAGGGPAGLAAAIRCAERGFHTVVYERAAAPQDKACGEGLMPSGRRELAGLKATPAGREFKGIRYLQEDGAGPVAHFRDGNGLAIRRTELSETLRARALQAGAELRQGSVQRARASNGSIEIETEAGAVKARLLIAADGLHSPLRKAAGLEGPPAQALRFGVRRHFAVKPWSDYVEVHWSAGVEAYVTPVADDCVNVAFLCEKQASISFDDLLARFPALREQVSGKTASSETRGAGPLQQSVKGRTAERLALIGDAAGYVDAITGQGLSLAFAAARLLAGQLPQDLSKDLRPALRGYENALRLPWLRYALPARALVALSRHPALRNAAIRRAGRFFDALVHWTE